MTEKFLWVAEGHGSDQIGRKVNLEGRTGVVIDGTVLTVTVQFDKRPNIIKRLWNKLVN